MKKALMATQKEFQSASCQTPEYLSWHRCFKRDFSAFLNDLGATDIQVRKPNHFDMSGFFRSASGQIWYFSISDIRWSKQSMLIRTAQSFTDYSGGRNQWVSLIDGELIFVTELKSIINNVI